MVTAIEEYAVSHRLLLAVFFCGVLSINALLAATDTTSLDISIQIRPACTLDSVDAVSATNVAGNIGAQSQSGQVRVTCTTGQTFTVSMGAGLNALGFQRRVHDGVNHISYNLLKQSNGNVWGTTGTAADTSMNGAGAGIAALSSTGIGVQQVFGYEVSYSLTGTESVGIYTDSVLITVEF
jgi:spore coat protein U-like protein